MNKTISDPQVLPPTILLGAVFLMLGFHFAFPVFIFIPPIGRLLGGLLVGIGVTISYLAEADFKKVGTTVHPFKESSELVTAGLFRFSRNPMYLGFALILLGLAILVGSLTPFGVIPVFMGWMQIKYIRVEEEMMESQFGRDWLEYTLKVRRWL
jgi:protein-S-isoprenylcysteine O-methyltransferase Ste14